MQRILKAYSINLVTPADTGNKSQEYSRGARIWPHKLSLLSDSGSHCTSGSELAGRYLFIILTLRNTHAGMAAHMRTHKHNHIIFAGTGECLFSYIRPHPPDGHFEKITSISGLKFFWSEIGNLDHLVQSLGERKRPDIAVVYSGAQINERQTINSIESHTEKSQYLRNGNLRPFLLTSGEWSRNRNHRSKEEMQRPAFEIGFRFSFFFFTSVSLWNISKS